MMRFNSHGLKTVYLKDYRAWCLLLSLLAMAALFVFPTHKRNADIYNLTFVIDITRSMNAEDYRIAEQPVSRLEFVKLSLREFVRSLPCQSKVGLGVFTERRSTILFEPIEVCNGYPELDKSIAALDWRMAWAADSRIAGGLLDAMQLLEAKETALVFISDGQEAPPLNPRYRTDFSALNGKLKGLILGVGGLQPVPIPKFDPKGHRIGVYGPDDVPHRAYFGDSDLNPEKIEGYDARNAPFGKHAAVGDEHMSALRESYLQQLAAETGLNYQRLQNDRPLIDIGQSPALGSQQSIESDRRYYFALCALGFFLAIFLI